MRQTGVHSHRRQTQIWYLVAVGLSFVKPSITGGSFRVALGSSWRRILVLKLRMRPQLDQAALGARTTTCAARLRAARAKW